MTVRWDKPRRVLVVWLDDSAEGADLLLQYGATIPLAGSNVFHVTGTWDQEPLLTAAMESAEALGKSFDVVLLEFNSTLDEAIKRALDVQNRIPVNIPVFLCHNDRRSFSLYRLDHSTGQFSRDEERVHEGKLVTWVYDEIRRMAESAS